MSRRSRMQMVLAVLCVAGLSTGRVNAAVVGPPTASSSFTPFSGSFVASNSVNGNSAEYASANGGTNTFIEWTFGAPVKFDRVILINRNSPAGGDRFAQVTLTYDGGAGGSDPIVTNSSRGRSDIYGVGPTTATTVRWDVDALGGGGAFNTGLMEAIFLRTPEHSSTVAGVSAFNSFAPFNANYAAANAVNGVVGFDNATPAGIEYASAGGGANMFIDFDLGESKPISGFDFIDRLPSGDQATDFNLVFSNVSNFATTVATINYTKGANAVAIGDSFDPINARYVRLEANAAGTNSGVNELIFYEHQVLPTPTILTKPSEFNTTQYAVEHLFDDQLTGTGSDWAASGEGPTTMVLDFGLTVFIDGINWANRNDSGGFLNDLPASIQLTFSDDLVFGGSDAVETITAIVPDQLLNAYMFGQLHATRYVQMVFTGENPPAGNVGGAQLEFFGVVPTPAALPAGLGLMALIAGRRRRA